MNFYTVDILTPSKVVAKDVPAEALLVPTVRGQINVLANHTHIVSKLETGVVSVFGGADDPDRYFSVTAGVCKVLNDKITILAKTSEESHEINLERAKEALANAEQMLDQHLKDDEYTKYVRKKERAQLRIQLCEFKG
ncbi:MAG: ATP synthase F1 subunit epsilon [Bacteriovoracaceae bacterium]